MDSCSVFDFETSWPDVQYCRILQVDGCTFVDNQVVDQQEWHLKQNVQIHPKARAKHGFALRDIQTRGIPSQQSLVDLLDAMRKVSTSVGHKTHSYNVPMLLAESQRLNSPIRSES